MSTSTSRAKPTSAQLLISATRGFDQLFANDIPGARRTFERPVVDVSPGTDASEVADSPFHQLGLGVAVFLEAALGLERERMEDAARVLNEAVTSTAAAKKAAMGGGGSWLGGGSAKGADVGLEYEILNADAVVLAGLVNALSESYMGYLQCIYALNSAHSKFTKLYKEVFPEGLEGYRTPSVSRKGSGESLATSFATSASSTTSSTGTETGSKSKEKKSTSMFSKWTGGSSLAVPVSKSRPTSIISTKGEGGEAVDEMILAGTAFGFGLFNLVFSLLPKRVQSVVGFFGFKHDRALALRALAVSAAKNDVHSVFAGLVLMTYHGVVLLLSGWQCDEAHIVRQYRAIVDKVEGRYPTGTLWVLNRAKILRMEGQSGQAVGVLVGGLGGVDGGVGKVLAPPLGGDAAEEKPNVDAKADETEEKTPLQPVTRWRQADTLLVFELAWTLLGDRRYEEAAGWFVRMTELNGWSHATYYFIACGCWSALANSRDACEEEQRTEYRTKARGLWDALPGLLERNGRKVGGKELPVEVLIRKKLTFYAAKSARLNADVISCMAISPAEEMAVFWNTHSRISREVAEGHVKEWAGLEPQVSVAGFDGATSAGPILDTAEERAIRALLLGIVLRTLGAYGASRPFFKEAQREGGEVKDGWVPGVAIFEEAVGILKEKDASGGEAEGWAATLKEVGVLLDAAMAASPGSVDLSSRLDSRVAMLRDEVRAKAVAEGVKL
ncbi:hypothetical protein BDZ89DRAFT_1113807 [Hymenopellis radicata]|nr:hypothetical protein BDZ89DRAFT_1113807 [Hymenopellis radicata]